MHAANTGPSTVVISFDLDETVRLLTDNATKILDSVEHVERFHNAEHAARDAVDFAEITAEAEDDIRDAVMLSGAPAGVQLEMSVHEAVRFAEAILDATAGYAGVRRYERKPF